MKLNVKAIRSFVLSQVVDKEESEALIFYLAGINAEFYLVDPHTCGEEAGEIGFMGFNFTDKVNDAMNAGLWAVIYDDGRDYAYHKYFLFEEDAKSFANRVGGGLLKYTNTANRLKVIAHFRKLGLIEEVPEEEGILE